MVPGLLFIWLAAAVPAHGATASVVYSEEGEGSSYTFSLEPSYAAEPGEKNELTVSVGDDAKGATAILFSDPGAVIKPGNGCVRLNEHRVRCEDEDDLGVNFHATVSLGDGDDTFETDTPSVVAGGSGDDVLAGSSGRDRLLGSRGSDAIRGGPGADSLDGGRGADDVEGGSGDDRIADAGGLNDTLDGGPGRDLLDLSSRRRSLLIDLASHVSGGQGENDSVLDIESAVAGRGDDIVIGDGGANRLRGGAGADRLTGRRGPDRLSGGRGPDTLFSRDGQRDVVSGGHGQDALRYDRGIDFVYNVERVF